MEHKFAIPTKLLMTDIFRNETGFELFIVGDDLSQAIAPKKKLRRL